MRFFINKTTMNANNANPLVLMYHRIAEPALDPWQLCVSPENFANQLNLLCNEFNTISGASSEIRHGRRPVVITFDDGYADNLYAAQPILEKYSTSATIFITTAYIGGQREYWWDELERLILLPGSLPKSLNLDSCGINFRYTLEEMTTYSAALADTYTQWKVTYDGQEPPTERHRFFLKLWRLLGGSTEILRQNVLDYLNTWASTPRVVRNSHRPMTEHELLSLHERGRLQVGSHCVTHTALPTLDTKSKRTELESSKSKLEAILNHSVTSLAYPHGEYDLETLKLAKEAKYSCAYGTQNPRFPNQWNRYQIPRMMVLNWGVQEFSRRLNLAFS